MHGTRAMTQAREEIKCTGRSSRPAALCTRASDRSVSGVSCSGSYDLPHGGMVHMQRRCLWGPLCHTSMGYEASCISTTYQPNVQAAPGNVCASAGPYSTVLGMTGSPAWFSGPGCVSAARKVWGWGVGLERMEPRRSRLELNRVCYTHLFPLSDLGDIYSVLLSSK